MKLSRSRIEDMLAKIEAALVPSPRKWLRIIIHEGDNGAEAKEKAKALAEHVARHPEDVGRTVEDFNWIVHEIVHTHQDPEMAATMKKYRAEEKCRVDGNGHDRQ
jgi:hypothetical protein